MKDDLGTKIMKKFVELRAKTYSQLIDQSGEDKKAKGTKKCVIKRKFKFENYVQKELNLRMKQIIQKKVKLTQIVSKNL